MRELKGIDVFGGNRKPDGSETTPIVIDWKQVKESGIAFALLRITELYGVDQRFAQNAAGCEAQKIPYGVYRYSYALTKDEAVKEAKDVVKALKGCKPSLPVFYDLEWNTQRNSLTPSQIEAVTLAFFGEVTKSGYKVGVYCNADWYRNVLTDKLRQYPLWIASYPTDDHGQVEERLRPTYPGVVCWQYSSKGTVPGINRATDMDIWYEEDKADQGVKPAGVTAQDVIFVMQSWLGRSEANGTHKYIVDLYNSHKPLARGYMVSYTDSWCDVTVSAVFILLNAVDLIGGTECGVEKHIQLFKAAGIWIEDGTITPLPGDIICFNWNQSSQPNDGFAGHIGIVEYVEAGVIHTIEGNASGEVRRRTYVVGAGNIRGFARPKYASDPVVDAPDPAPVAPDPVPATPSPETSDTLATVYPGDSSKAARLMQLVLRGRGYKDDRGKALSRDGKANDKTVYALKKFQEKFGLEVDGICGPKTWTKLLGL